MRYVSILLMSAVIGATAHAARDLTDVTITDTQIDTGSLNVNKCLIYSDYMCIKCDLSGKSLTNLCNIRNVSESDLSLSDLSGVNARDSAFDKADLGAAVANNANFENGSFYGTVFYETQLHGANFQNAQFSLKDAFNAEFFAANLTGARMKGKFQEADFSGANLTDADMSYANMRGGKFNASTVFNNTNVKGTDFRGADEFIPTYFWNANLLGMKGVPKLDSNIHWQNVTCPDGTIADLGGPQFTCEGHFIP